jgi:ABC-type multidrug transport system fused ATPase/permease subunit
MRVVKAFAQELREIDRFEIRSQGVLDYDQQLARVRSMFTPTSAFITSMGTMIVWWVGGEQVLGEALALGTFTAFTGYMWQFYGPVENLGDLNHRFQLAATSAERV